MGARHGEHGGAEHLSLREYPSGRACYPAYAALALRVARSALMMRIVSLSYFTSSAHARQRAKNARHKPDSMLDLTDIPEARDAQLRRARRVGRPSTGNAKQLIAIRISPKVLARLRRLAAKQHKPYQTYIHELLEQAAGRKVA